MTRWGWSGFLLTASLAVAAAAGPGPGISERLAQERSAAIASLRYELKFAVPEARSESVHGWETVRFKLRTPGPVVLDFDQPRDRVLSVRAGDRPVEAAFNDGHLTIPASATRSGENTIAIEFLAGDQSLNRNDDFLYTLFVPARAHLAFPCFDQPDLKARYTLTLELPADWQAVANGAEAGREGNVLRFAETQPLPAYLFAFAAGKFSLETAIRNGRTFRMLHRETDAQKVARNRDAVFDLHAQ